MSGGALWNEALNGGESLERGGLTLSAHKKSPAEKQGLMGDEGLEPPTFSV